MTTDELLQRWSDGSITADELRELTAKLAKPEHQSALLDDWLLESSLPDRLPGAAVAGLHESSMNRRIERIAPVRAKQWAGWLSWRPLTAAAAGIVFGMFCTSVVFGFVAQGHGVKKTPLAVVQPSFEDAQMPLAKGFPPAPALWTGDVAKVVPAENGIAPKDGHHMLKLETTVDGKPVLFPRLYQVIALPPSGNELREIEVSAAFASADSGSSPHYSIRAYAIAQEAEQLGPDWFSHRNEAIASAATGFDCPPVTSGWQSFGLRIQVPSKARSLVVFFGVKNQAKSPAKLPHYLDAVHVSLVDSPRIP